MNGDVNLTHPITQLPNAYKAVQPVPISVTTVLLSGANERRHYQPIGPSLTPLPENNGGLTMMPMMPWHGAPR